MSVVCERVGSFRKEVTADGIEASLAYTIRGPASRAAAEEALLGVVAQTVEGFYLSRYVLQEPTSSNLRVWTAEVVYSSVKPKSLVGFAVSFRGRSQLIKRLYAPVVSFVGDIDPATMSGAMNIDESGIPQGADVPDSTTELIISATLEKGSITMGNVATWVNQQGKVNSNAMGVYAPGMLRFENFAFTAGNQQKDTVEFSFLIARPVVVSFNGDDITKAGHDFLNVVTRKWYDATNNFMGAKVLGISVHRPLEWTDFSGIFRYGPDPGADLLTAAVFTAF